MTTTPPPQDPRSDSQHSGDEPGPAAPDHLEGVSLVKSGQRPAAVPSPGATSQPVASGLAMRRRNAVTVWILWPVITLGIYHLVWYYKIHKEIAEFDRRRATPVAGPVLVLIFLSWTIIAPLISYHNAGRRIRSAQTSAGLAATCSPTLCWLLAFAVGLNTLYMQTELNKIVDRYPGASAGTLVPLYG